MLKKFNPDYVLLEDMYNDDYFPDFLVDKVKAQIQRVIDFLEQGDYPLDEVQAKFDEMTLAINALDAEFNENDSEIETAARESIGAAVIYILEYFAIDLDVEDAIREREW